MGSEVVSGGLGIIGIALFYLPLKIPIVWYNTNYDLFIYYIPWTSEPSALCVSTCVRHVAI